MEYIVFCQQMKKMKVVVTSNKQSCVSTVMLCWRHCVSFINTCVVQRYFANDWVCIASPFCFIYDTCSWNMSPPNVCRCHRVRRSHRKTYSIFQIHRNRKWLRLEDSYTDIKLEPWHSKYINFVKPKIFMENVGEYQTLQANTNIEPYTMSVSFSNVLWKKDRKCIHTPSFPCHT